MRLPKGSTLKARSYRRLTRKGFKDVPFIQRGNRKFHYDINWVKPKPLVKRRHCYEIAERVDSQGEILSAPDEEGIQRRSVHPARQPQVPQRHQLGKAEATGQAQTLL